MTADKIIENAKVEVRKIVDGGKKVVSSQVVIARYTAAMAVNFTDWIGKTIPWIRHEIAYCALVDNLRCEAGQDHVGMLLRFATFSESMPTRENYAYIHDEVANIRKLFAEPATAGLSGVALCATLEVTSEVFIPDLADRAVDLGCADLTYTNVHGEADAEHGRALLKAVEAEATMGFHDAGYFIENAAQRAVALISRIYT